MNKKMVSFVLVMVLGVGPGASNIFAAYDEYAKDWNALAGQTHTVMISDGENQSGEKGKENSNITARYGYFQGRNVYTESANGVYNLLDDSGKVKFSVVSAGHSWNVVSVNLELKDLDTGGMSIKEMLAKVSKTTLSKEEIDSIVKTDRSGKISGGSVYTQVKNEIMAIEQEVINEAIKNALKDVKQFTQDEKDKQIANKKAEIAELEKDKDNNKDKITKAKEELKALETAKVETLEDFEKRVNEISTKVAKSAETKDAVIVEVEKYIGGKGETALNSFIFQRVELAKATALKNKKDRIKSEWLTNKFIAIGVAPQSLKQFVTDPDTGALLSKSTYNVPKVVKYKDSEGKERTKVYLPGDHKLATPGDEYLEGTVSGEFVDKVIETIQQSNKSVSLSFGNPFSGPTATFSQDGKVMAVYKSNSSTKGGLIPVSLYRYNDNGFLVGLESVNYIPKKTENGFMEMEPQINYTAMNYDENGKKEDVVYRLKKFSNNPEEVIKEGIKKGTIKQAEKVEKEKEGTDKPDDDGEEDKERKEINPITKQLEGCEALIISKTEYASNNVIESVTDYTTGNTTIYSNGSPERVVNSFGAVVGQYRYSQNGVLMSYFNAEGEVNGKVVGTTTFYDQWGRQMFTAVGKEDLSGNRTELIKEYQEGLKEGFKGTRFEFDENGKIKNKKSGTIITNVCVYEDQVLDTSETSLIMTNGHIDMNKVRKYLDNPDNKEMNKILNKNIKLDRFGITVDIVKKTLAFSNDGHSALFQVTIGTGGSVTPEEVIKEYEDKLRREHKLKEEKATSVDGKTETHYYLNSCEKIGYTTTVLYGGAAVFVMKKDHISNIDGARIVTTEKKSDNEDIKLPPVVSLRQGISNSSDFAIDAVGQTGNLGFNPSSVAASVAINATKKILSSDNQQKDIQFKKNGNKEVIKQQNNVLSTQKINTVEDIKRIMSDIRAINYYYTTIEEKDKKVEELLGTLNIKEKEKIALRFYSKQQQYDGLIKQRKSSPKIQVVLRELFVLKQQLLEYYEERKPKNDNVLSRVAVDVAKKTLPSVSGSFKGKIIKVFPFTPQSRLEGSKTSSSSLTKPGVDMKSDVPHGNGHVVPVVIKRERKTTTNVKLDQIDKDKQDKTNPSKLVKSSDLVSKLDQIDKKKGKISSGEGKDTVTSASGEEITIDKEEKTNKEQEAEKEEVTNKKQEAEKEGVTDKKQEAEKEEVTNKEQEAEKEEVTNKEQEAEKEEVTNKEQEAEKEGVTNKKQEDETTVNKEKENVITTKSESVIVLNASSISNGTFQLRKGEVVGLGITSNQIAPESNDITLDGKISLDSKGFLIATIDSSNEFKDVVQQTKKSFGKESYTGTNETSRYTTNFIKDWSIGVNYLFGSVATVSNGEEGEVKLMF